ncbi:protein CutA isoform X3 [Crotalus tigris]|nr:protein CutA isoform X3 [Crotalus tigris]
MLPALQRFSGRLFSASSSSSMAAEPPLPPAAGGGVSAAFVTCPNETVAKDLARALVEQRLAACVNVLPGVTSIYRWKGAVEEDAEVLLPHTEPCLQSWGSLNVTLPPPRQMIKTRSSRVSALAEYVRSVHPYEVAEVIALPIQQGNPPYLRWVEEAVPPE